MAADKKRFSLIYEAGTHLILVNFVINVYSLRAGFVIMAAILLHNMVFIYQRSSEVIKFYSKGENS